MIVEPDAIRCCLRALAQAQATYFYRLWTDLYGKPMRAGPRLQFQIGRSDAGGDSAFVTLFVDAAREDSREVTWAVELFASSDRLDVSCYVGVNDDDGFHKVFDRSASTTLAREAADAIDRLAAEVCAQGQYIQAPPT